MTIPDGPGNRFDRLGLVASLAAIAAATLIPAAGPKPDLSPFCVRCGTYGGPDFVLNILLFAPFGVFAWRLARRARAVVLWGLTIAVAIELVQLALPGRATQVRDALTNAMGAAVGVWLARRSLTWFAPGRATSWRLAGAVAFAIATVGITGPALGFSPAAPPYFGHWTPKQRHLEHWSGRITAASLDGIPVPDWRLDDPDAIARAMRDGFDLRLTGISGRATGSLGGIMSISDAAMFEMLLVGLEHEDLIIRVRRRSAVVRFDAPEIRFPGFLAQAPEGQPFALRVEARPGGTCATLAGERRCDGPVTAGRAWSLLRSFDGASPAARILLDAVTLAALAVLVGLFVPAVPRSHGGTAVAALFVLVPLAAVAGGSAAPTALEWGGLAAGCVAGIAVGRLVSRTPTPLPAPAAP